MRQVELIRLSDRRRVDELQFIIRGGGIPCALRPVVDYEEGGFEEGRGIYWSLLVPEDKLEQARTILAEEGFRGDGEHAGREEAPAAAGRPPLTWIVGLVVINVLAWIAKTGTGAGDRATMLRFGAAHAPLITSGQWWRTVAAVFLHFGIEHLLANMITLSILGPAALREWGAGRFLFMYLAAGVAGNWFSFALSPSLAVKAGASGAVLGLLGVLAGTRIRAIRAGAAAGDRSRFKTWHIVAMLVAFYGFVVGVGKQVDHLAHVGGLLAGGLLATGMPRPTAARPARRLGVALGLIALVLTLAAGLLAFVQGA